METKQFGKTLPSLVFLLVLIELFSLATFVFKPLHNVAFVVVVILLFRLLFKQPGYALPIILTELAIGGKGYLFWFGFGGINISIRMAIFIIALAFWAAPLVRHPAKIKEYRYLISKPAIIALGLLVVAIALQLWHGLNANALSNVLLDFNAWVFFALIVVFIAHVLHYDMDVVYETACGAILFLAGKAIIALYLFSHGITGVGGIFYGWIRDTGVGEITHISGPMFRIFFQSQLYALFGCVMALAFLLFYSPITTKQRTGLWLFFYLTTLSVIISQSRSFWIGLAAGVASIFIYAYIVNHSKRAVIISAVATALILVSHFFSVGFISGNYDGNILAKRFNNLPSEPASATRLNQLNPLQQAITERPIIGYGFGKTLTYTSDDPRIRSQHPDGQFTTYTFEWGYYDLWLKFGALGLTIYLAYIANVGFSIGRAALMKKDVIAIGIFTGLISLLAVHNFSPYLNHPLGIGFLLFATALALKQKDPPSQVTPQNTV